MVKKTRNSGTMTESQFFNWIKYKIREMSMYWKPGNEYLKSVRQPRSSVPEDALSPYFSTEKGLKDRSRFLYKCEHCNLWFRRKDVEKDHIVPTGHVHSFEDIGRVFERMFIEVDGGWQCLCTSCHVVKSKSERGVYKNDQ